MGQPGCPLPLREGQALPPARAWGNLAPPVTSGPMRGARHARCTRPGSAGGPPAARLRGHGDGPPPQPSPRCWGEGVRLLPPAGGGWEGGCGATWGLALAAYFHVSRPCGFAAQRRNENKFVLGRAAPSQTLPRAGVWGNPVSPFPCGAGAWGNQVSPHPSSRAYVHVSMRLRRTTPQ